MDNTEITKWVYLKDFWFAMEKIVYKAGIFKASFDWLLLSRWLVSELADYMGDR